MATSKADKKAAAKKVHDKLARQVEPLTAAERMQLNAARAVLGK